MAEDREIIPGFALVFPPSGRDHRIYSVPGKYGKRFTLSAIGLRDGLSLWTFAYFFGALLLMAVLRHLPLVGLLFGWIWWPVAYPLFAFAVAYVLTTVEPEGRHVLRWLAGLWKHYTQPRDRCAGRRIRAAGAVAVLSPVTAVATDQADPVLGPCRVHGPATVRFRDPVSVRPARRKNRYVAQPASDSSTVRVELDAGEMLVVHP